VKEAVSIGSRLEMFVDDWLIEDKQGVGLKLHSPVRKETVLEFDREWEGAFSGYVTVIQREGKVQLYYRGNCTTDLSEDQVTCYAESADGIHFDKPNLGLYDYAGSNRNNVVLKGSIAHNFAPFYDTNPAADPKERYKAVGGIHGDIINNRAALHGLVSEDGLRWTMKQQEPIMTNGAFDSQNIAFWDANRSMYRCYNRYFTPDKIRGVQSALSANFVNWEPQQLNRYAEGVPFEHFYTNATILCPQAEHIYVSFPMRFIESRKKVAEHPYNRLSDAVFMTSRDGVNWDRTFLEGWIRPGLDRRNWTDRNMATAYGCVESDTEFSFYLTENYRWQTAHLHRYAVRKHGFASVHAGYEEGEFTTRPVRFTGSRLFLNYSTSVAGSIQAEVLDEQGRTIENLSFADMEPLYGDELQGEVTWKSGAGLEALDGKTVRFRFRLKDADLFAMQVK
jgi:hypothetical protein